MTSFAAFLAAPALALGLLVAAPGFADSTAPAIETALTQQDISEKKQTKAGLYLTAAEAGQALEARDDLILIDVRTPEETMLIGYADATDANIPFLMFDPGLAFDDEKDGYRMQPNPAFVALVQAYLARPESAAKTTLLVMCRSGDRSAKAVDALNDAGIDARIYSVIDGFEGDKDDSGLRSVNGWRNAGLPWSYKVTPDLWPRSE